MTDPAPPSSPRDAASGKFVKRPAEEVPETPVLPGGVQHPASKLLFGWTEHKRADFYILIFVALASLFLIAADLLIHRKEYFSFAQITGFYGLYGFAAFALVVLSGWPLGLMLRRRVNYYEEPDGVPRHTDPALGAAVHGDGRS